MGLYLRKSFKMGPVRLNLSKSGLGASVGVKGARIGVNAKGRAYAHAGAGGLYYRETLSGPTRAQGRAAGPAETTYARTGAGYAPERTAPTANPLEFPRPVRANPWYAFTTAVVGFVTLVFGGGGFLSVFGGAVLISAGWLAVVAFRRQAALDPLRELLAEATQTGAWGELDRYEERALVPREWSAEEYRWAYFGLCHAVVRDGVVAHEERARLAELERRMDDDAFARAARRDAFHAFFQPAAAEGHLSPDRVAVLEHLRDRLDLSALDVGEEMEYAAYLGRLNAVREGRLLPVAPSVALQKGEACYFEAPGRVLKEKQLDSYQSAGQRYKVRGLVLDKEGTLLVTNKRVLLVHAGTTSVRLDKILDVRLDTEENALYVTKDSSERPMILSTPDAPLAAVTLKALLAGSIHA